MASNEPCSLNIFLSSSPRMSCPKIPKNHMHFTVVSWHMSNPKNYRCTILPKPSKTRPAVVPHKRKASGVHLSCPSAFGVKYRLNLGRGKLDFPN